MLNFNEKPLNTVLKILLRGLKIDNFAAVKPRAQKSDAEKIFRTRTNAEVFTPSRVVKFMVDALDDGQIDSRWLEIACGEAPFITNRYDAESGELIPHAARAGVLDKKLRRIPPHAEKFTWASRAVQSVYGYDIQPDSLLIARANVFLTAAEFVADCSVAELNQLAEIVAWNFFLLDGMQDNGMFGTDAEIVDWLNDGEKFFFGGVRMKKFDFVISNPPYHEEKDDNARQPPIYDKFIIAAQKVAEKVVLITPARFLFNAGQTSKEFNNRMLNDPHFKILEYAPDARRFFRGVEIEGGVAITLRDETKNFGSIGIFTPFKELNSLHKKICVDDKNFRPLTEIAYTPIAYKFSEKFFVERPELLCKLQKSDDNALRTNIFERVPEIFLDDKPDDGNEYLKILGRIETDRVYKFIRREYVTAPELLDKFKVFVPEANGASGKLISNEAVRIISVPVVGSPLEGCTQTFITVGAFDTRAEADACIAYIKSKFCRVMLGILKVTQHNPPATWAKVPLQDFTSASDIDWQGDIDAQLYRKYHLTAAEIAFIERHVKAMI